MSSRHSRILIGFRTAGPGQRRRHARRISRTLFNRTHRKQASKGLQKDSQDKDDTDHRRKCVSDSLPLSSLPLFVSIRKYEGP